MHTTATRFLLCLTLLTTLVLANSTTSAADFSGRWNLQIQDTGDTFASAWLKLDIADEPTGALVWRSGSVVPIEDINIDGNKLTFRRGGDRFRATLDDNDVMRGGTTNGRNSLSFIGKRATEMCDVAGTWHAWQAGDANGPRASIRLALDGTNVTGTATDPDGNSWVVRDAKLQGRTLTFNAVLADTQVDPRTVTFEIQGDQLKGAVILPADGNEPQREIPIEGERQREWGEPVRLLQANSLDGWKPRDPSKKFGWKVTDGVLENSPPDVDIVSDAKFRDFKLDLEYFIEPGSNSGCYLRGRYELQILGDTQVQDHGNMAVYSRLKPNKNPLKLGEWNHLEVTFIGRWLTVTLNGQVVHDHQYLEGPTGGAFDYDEDQPGPVLLQGDHGKVQYRNIVITPVK